MIKKLTILVFALTSLTLGSVEAQNKRPAARKAPATSSSRQLEQALAQIKAGQFANAASNLYSLSRRPELAKQRPQIKYTLGVALMELKLNQVAAFQFVDVIRSGNSRYTRQAIEKLSFVANELGDDTILDYAISKVQISEFPQASRDMIFYRLGEAKSNALNFKEAIDFYERVPSRSPYFMQAVYGKGLAQLADKQVDEAIRTFANMREYLRNSPVTDPNRVIAQLSLARALYQKQDWERAIAAYAEVPRDTSFWHEALFEQSWAMLRGARFRSAMSNFHTLHSSYYEDSYNPESLLLRSIVYLYICKYDEMEKVLSLFEKTYGPVSRQIADFLKFTKDPAEYFSEIDKANVMSVSDKKLNLKLPMMVSLHIQNESNVRRSMNYLKKLMTEKQKIEGSESFKNSPLGRMGLKILNNRMKNTRVAIGEKVKAHLVNMRTEMRDLYEQAGFIRYEMINGQKETVKKRIAGKDVETTIDENINREFYIKNGYQYYPFSGEYWLDEIGNYHYLGKSSCE
ncbi:MAG: tetratricopeptide repeat protein [Bdellovibrionia bacterium]